MINSILKGFDIWTDAQGMKSKGRLKSIDNISFEGMARLREVILDLAIRGKLVAQDDKDEPAFALLERCLDEVVVIDEEDEPFAAPRHWTWVYLGNIALVERGGSPRPIASYLTDSEDGLNWIKIGDTQKGSMYINSTEEKIRKEGLDKTRMVYPGDFLLTNSMSFGRPYITNIKGCIHDGWLRIHFPAELNRDYLYYLLSSRFVYSFFKDAAAGAVVQNLNSDKVRELPLVIPPIEEQGRIVRKIEQLMAFCDQLEVLRTASLTTHHHLVGALLATLVNAAGPDELQMAWEKISAQLETLFRTEDSIEQLKQAILQLAIMGKLVKQDPGEAPASELIKEIARERGRLVQGGKKERERLVEGGKKEIEHPFELPAGWAFIRFGDVAFNRDAERVPLSVDERSGRKGPYDYYGASGVIDHIDQFLFEKPLLLIGEDGANLINRTTPIAFIARGKYWVNNHAHVIDGISEDLLQFLCLHINAISLLPYITGTAQPKMNQAKLNSIIISLPPAEEQKRIIAKVDELFALCDALNARIVKAQQIQNVLSQIAIR